MSYLRITHRVVVSEERFLMSEGSFGGREVVIVEAVRTSVGRGHEEKGYYKEMHA